eukprot:GHVU01021779.1.p1 GENE.GHVU01021779.1~~GHVU01021779.1.p1  ORF type:complete len:269 (-),score=57.06 GHVU01021779.1:475-1281(-)
MDPPAPETMMRALEQLNYLKALDDEGELTDTGSKMADLPLAPQLAKMLVESPKFHCTPEILSITAMLSVPNVFVRPRDQAREADDMKAKFTHMDGDHLTLLNVYNAYVSYSSDRRKFCQDHYLNPRTLASAESARNQLERQLDRMGLDRRAGTERGDRNYVSNIKRAILAGFFMQAAHAERSGVYSTIKDRQVVALHPSCVLTGRHEWVVYHEFVLTSKNFIRTVTQIRGEWLVEEAAHYFDPNESNEEFPDSSAKRQLRDIYKRVCP